MSVCASRRLARAQIDTALIDVITRMSNVELIAEPQWLASTCIGGSKTLPIRVTPGSQLSRSQGRPTSK
jgi:hypothetical protein